MMKIPKTFLMASAIAAAAMLVLATSGTFGVQEAYAAKQIKVKSTTTQVNACSSTATSTSDSSDSIGTVDSSTSSATASSTTCTNDSSITITAAQ